MQFINRIKEKFNDTKEWCIEHKELLLSALREAGLEARIVSTPEIYT